MGNNTMAFRTGDGSVRAYWIGLSKLPGKSPVIAAVVASLEGLQDYIGGHIETVTLADDLVIICDEEGRLKGLPYNCTIGGVSFCGPVLVLGVEGEDFASLPMGSILDEWCRLLFGCTPAQDLEEDEDAVIVVLDDEEDGAGAATVLQPDPAATEGTVTVLLDNPDAPAIIAMDDEEGDDDDAG